MASDAEANQRIHQLRLGTQIPKTPAEIFAALDELTKEHIGVHAHMKGNTDKSAWMHDMATLAIFSLVFAKHRIGATYYCVNEDTDIRSKDFYITELGPGCFVGGIPSHAGKADVETNVGNITIS